MRSATFLAAVLLVMPPAIPAQAQLPADFDQLVAGVMADHEVPGLAIAVVKDGKVVLAKGYGVRELGRPERVDEHTRFGIASNTKAFTATALALLVEDGLIEWDKPVIEYLPWFRLSDAWVTSQLSVRDLLVHRSGLGLGAGDLLWWPQSTYTRREVAERLRFLPLVTSFRSAYAYDNVLYTVAGELIHEVTGKTWEEFVTERIIKPLGMNETIIRHPGIGSSDNISSTHAKVESKVRPIAPFVSDNTNPAGGITTSAHDITRWMMVQLDSGRVEGNRRLFRPGTTRELWQVVTPLAPRRYTDGRAPLSSNFAGYALGFNVLDYRRHKLVTHTGGLPGFISRVALMPELNLGVAVFTNHESSAMEPIVYSILDHHLGERHDWRSVFRELAARNDAAIAAADSTAAATRDSTSRPARPTAEYAGTYRDAWYGDIEVTNQAGKLGIRFTRSPSLVGDLSHWQYETFLVRWHDRELRADAFITFQLGPDGKVASARMAPASPSVDFSFDFQDLHLLPVRK